MSPVYVYVSPTVKMEALLVFGSCKVGSQLINIF
jgi:hypothetical protein